MSRMLWVLVLAALAALAIYGMRRGWLNRARRQRTEIPELPQLPVEPGAELLPSMRGLYIGTTRATDWQDRIAVGDIGLRSNVLARVHERGLLLERTGAQALWIPAAAMRAARVDHKLANKVVPGVGMVVVTWRLGDLELDTGVRGGDRDTHVQWVEALNSTLRQSAGEGQALDGDEEAGACDGPPQEAK